MPISLPFRQIHLDFHTSPAIDDVGVNFEPEQFADTMLAAHVNSVNLFAKCHHGHLYYDTERPERHPGLCHGLPLLEAQVEALQRRGIKTPIYISVQCDEYAANTHPEWLSLEADGRPVGAGPTQAGWTILDMSSGYQDYLAAQTAEILERFRPVDGIWFDMCWDQTSSSNAAIASMLSEGFDPEQLADRQKHARLVARRYMRRFHDMVKASSPDALVFFNCRPFPILRDEIGQFEQVEIEALPTGGWSYLYFSTNVRYVRTLGKPTLGMTARFHKSWADFGGLKPEPALMYETAQMVAHGAVCCIGDQLHPRGTLDAAAYDLIGRTYKQIEEREPWLAGATPVTQAAVLAVTENDAKPAFGSVIEGAVRMLTQLKVQFDIVDRKSDWGRYELVVLPDSVPVDEAFAAQLSAFVAKGGKVLATGHSGLSETGETVVWPSLGISAHGNSPFTTTYLRFGDIIAGDRPPTDHVMYDSGVRVKTTTAKALAMVVEPYFERTYRHFSSHFQTPSDRVTEYAAAVLNGGVGYIPYPIFSAFANHGSSAYRFLVKSILDRLIEPIIDVKAPTGTEVTLTRQPGRTIVHLIHFSPERRSPGLDLIEDVIPLYRIPVTLKLDSAPSKVTIVPDLQDLDFCWKDGRVKFDVPEVNGHAMIVVENG